MKRGFTLMELAVVIGVMSIVGLASVAIFYRALRGTNKSDTIKRVNQNSQLVLEVMSRFIRNAKRVQAVGMGDCPGTSNNITLLGSDDKTVQFTLQNGRVASNGSYISDPSVLISNLQFSCTRTSGAPDSIQINFNTVATASANDAQTVQDYNTTINLRSYTSQ